MRENHDAALHGYSFFLFSFEFIAKIQLTRDAVVAQTRFSLLLFLFLRLSLYVCADAHVHLDLPCGSPESDLWSSKKLFQAGGKGDKHSKQ